jgi:hypothetical protein
VEPGASVDSQDALYGCPVCGFTPRDAATVIMSYLRIGADPLDSLDCSTVARGDALAALRRLRAAVRRRWVATELTEVAKIDNRTSKQFNFHKW